MIQYFVLKKDVHVDIVGERNVDYTILILDVFALNLQINKNINEFKFEA